MENNFSEIEAKWRKYWNDNNIYKVEADPAKPKFYVLDMFPYPSGAGLHVGHPLGYIATDIYSRYKRLKGFNVLHPMGFDSFGLPAEQYAIETGQQPAVTTEKNIATFKSQLDKIGFSYDWSREVKTSDPAYYKYTQWIFLQLFNHWYDRNKQKAVPIAELINLFKKEGNKNVVRNDDETIFTETEWANYTEAEQSDILLQYRLAYSSFGEVNWCEALGTVLANDEVINGVSERGGYPVEKRKMRQWYLRITEYADRLLSGLDAIDFSDAMKDMQRNWIGKSPGATIEFKVASDSEHVIKVFTTRPETIFGVDFIVLAPELALVDSISTADQKAAVSAYKNYVNSRSDRERMADVKQITGAFTGAYAIHPFTGNKIPIWTAEYVLAGYGTGAIMAVPCADQRDFSFAQHFKILITNIIGDAYNGSEANPAKNSTLSNSNFLNGLTMQNAVPVVMKAIEEKNIGKLQTNYKMHDAGYSRQRYWGEPFPIVWYGNVPKGLPESDLPVILPYMENYKPGPNGEGPLANLTGWIDMPDGGKRENSTMPGYAGSSWYFLRFMDPHNSETFCSRTYSDYWNQVDVYVGGTEHAVGHLLYSRMWTKFLYDIGEIGFDEPFKKLINQGMIQGSSRFVYRLRNSNTFVSYNKKDAYDTTPLHVDVSLVNGYELDMEGFKKWRPDNADAEFITEDNGKYICGSEVEKMSKTKYNTVNPDDLVQKYGADTFRMYEMFLGPIEQSKPWETKGIEGVSRFLRKLWRLFFNEENIAVWTDEAPSQKELVVINKAIKKIDADTNNFSYNTAVSAFMVSVNDLTELNSHKKQILEPLIILLAPYAPYTAEELWHQLGNTGSVVNATYPTYNEDYTVDAETTYPVSINGKMRAQIVLPTNTSQTDAEQAAINNPAIQKWIDGNPIKKIIFVKGKMINIVV